MAENDNNLPDDGGGRAPSRLQSAAGTLKQIQDKVEVTGQGGVRGCMELLLYLPWAVFHYVALAAVVVVMLFLVDVRGKLAALTVLNVGGKAVNSDTSPEAGPQAGRATETAAKPAPDPASGGPVAAATNPDGRDLAKPDIKPQRTPTAMSTGEPSSGKMGKEGIGQEGLHENREATLGAENKILREKVEQLQNDVKHLQDLRQQDGSLRAKYEAILRLLGVADPTANAPKLDFAKPAETRGYTIASGLIALKNALGTDLGTIKTDLGAVKTDLSTIQTDLSTVKTDLGGLKGGVGALKSGLGTDGADLVTTIRKVLDNKLGNLTGSLGAIPALQTALQEALSDGREAGEQVALVLFDTMNLRINQYQRALDRIGRRCSYLPLYVKNYQLGVFSATAPDNRRVILRPIKPFASLEGEWGSPQAEQPIGSEELGGFAARGVVPFLDKTEKTGCRLALVVSEKCRLPRDESWMDFQTVDIVMIGSGLKAEQVDAWEQFCRHNHGEFILLGPLGRAAAEKQPPGPSGPPATKPPASASKGAQTSPALVPVKAGPSSPLDEEMIEALALRLDRLVAPRLHLGEKKK
jgi:hypothetical protein